MKEIKTETISVKFHNGAVEITDFIHNEMSIKFNANSTEFAILNFLKDEKDESTITTLAYLIFTSRLIISAPGFIDNYIRTFESYLTQMEAEDSEDEETVLKELETEQNAKEVLLKGE